LVTFRQFDNSITGVGAGVGHVPPCRTLRIQPFVVPVTHVPEFGHQLQSRVTCSDLSTHCVHSVNALSYDDQAQLP
jgi:hypothetical protein